MKAFIAIILLVFVVGCANKNDPHQITNANAAVATSYQLSNGICYSTTTGQQVASGFCTSTNSGYYSNNGFCYMSSTGQQVDNSFCSTNTTSGSQCVGVYIWNGSYVQCNGSNCRGYTLIQATTGTSVVCQ